MGHTNKKTFLKICHLLFVLSQCYPCSVQHDGVAPRQRLATKGLLTQAQVDFMSDQNGVSCLIDRSKSCLHITTEIAECLLLFRFSVSISRFIDPSDYLLRGNHAYEA